MKEHLSCPRTVLVVEDDSDVREALVEVLVDAGYRVVPAQHGKHAVDLLRGGEAPAIVVTDLMMPIMNGKALVEWVRNNHEQKWVPIVVVTAYGDSRVPGANHVLQKPLSVEVLLELLRSLVGVCPSSSPD
jgi:CheY-like chemotaxis protein